MQSRLGTVPLNGKFDYTGRNEIALFPKKAFDHWHCLRFNTSQPFHSDYKSLLLT